MPGQVNGVLTIKGEKQEETEKKEKDYYLQERSFGSFERSFEVPESIEVDKSEASFKKGVLTLTLPKKAELKSLQKNRCEGSLSAVDDLQKNIFEAPG
jgi:HSP20 family protein